MREPVTHELPVETRFFDALAAGTKTHELRRDRGFTVGDRVELFDQHRPQLDALRFEITHVLTHDDFPNYGLRPGFVVLSLRPVKEDT